MNNSAALAARHFPLDGELTCCEPYGFGHINRTFLVVTDKKIRYILQGINHNVFADVPGLMNNISLVTRHIAKKISDPRGVLCLVPADTGADFYLDGAGQYWRVYEFVENSLCLQAPESPADFYQSAIAFGTFQNQLADFDAGQLVETIPNFHNTPDRYRIFHEVLAADKLGRASGAQYEIEEFLKREQDGCELANRLAAGILPLKVTHNDTKLNNVMLDDKTRKALCVIDLDTVMPGLAAYDFGDSIRFGASTAAEDEKDLERVSMDLELFKIYASGYLAACPNLTAAERDSLVLGAKTMTLECGLRFLTDYLDGDTYFAIHRPEHNLDRCRTQLKLVQDMERKWDEMNEIVRALG